MGEKCHRLAWRHEAVHPRDPAEGTLGASSLDDMKRLGRAAQERAVVSVGIGHEREQEHEYESTSITTHNISIAVTSAPSSTHLLPLELQWLVVCVQ